MRKLFLYVFLIFIIFNPAYSEWKIIYSTEESEQLIDKSNFKKEGKTIFYWHLTNYLKKNDLNMRSSLTYTEVDCHVLRGKDHVFNYYTEYMGKGDLLGDFTPSNEWNYPKPGTVRLFLYSEVCKK